MFFDIFRGYKMGTRVGNKFIVGTYIGNHIYEKDIIKNLGVLPHLIFK